MVYLKSVENVITLGKLIGLLFLFCLPLLSILFLKTKRNDLARPVMGTIFLVLADVMNISINSEEPALPDLTCTNSYLCEAQVIYENLKKASASVVI